MSATADYWLCLVPVFEAQHDARLQVLLTGSGRALQLLSRGEADVAISHAPAIEAVVLRDHPAWLYRKIMFNDFLIVGPPGDPSHVAGASDVRDAMRRLASGKGRIVSRGDDSGTDTREGALWRDAGIAPPADGRVITGQGMGATLRIASQLPGYTLTDRATYLQLRPRLHLAPLFEGGSELLNTYAVIAPTGRDTGSALAAMRFATWLADGGARELIAAYEVTGGMPGFTIWPANAPRRAPSDLPH